MLYCDTSAGKPRIYVPSTLRRQVFDSLHGLSHPGIRATTRLITQRYVWPAIRKDCRLWAKTCMSCQRSKVSRHTVTPCGDFPLPAVRFSHIHVDLVGPLPSSAGYQYCLTAIDRFTRWPEAIPISDITAETISRALLSGCISRFGCPLTITTDQGRQFESQLFRSLSSLCGFYVSRTTPHHPASNGMVERFHRSMKVALMCHAGDQSTDALPLVLLGLRAAFKEDIQASAADMVYGEPLRIPGELVVAGPQHVDSSVFIQQLRSTVNKLRPTPASHHATPGAFVHHDLSTCSHVFLRQDGIRRSLQPPYSGPFSVLSRTDKTFTILIRDKSSVVSADRVKPAFFTPDDFVAVKPSSPVRSSAPTIPAVLPTQTTVQPPPPLSSSSSSTTHMVPLPCTTRSGRRVHFPARFIT